MTEGTAAAGPQLPYLFHCLTAKKRGAFPFRSHVDRTKQGFSRFFFAYLLTTLSPNQNPGEGG